MTSPGQRESVTWADGATPVSALFGDPYFSLEGGLDETRHVFLAGNGLPGRFRPGLSIAETGFGTGLNLLATVAAWLGHGVSGRFAFTSFEAFPMPVADMARAHAAFPELEPLSDALRRRWAEGERRFALGPADVTVIEGDARHTLPAWGGRADVWFLDGFAPARNPDLWGEEVLGAVARHTAPGGTFATYTAAGAVRRRLAAAGFSVERVPGFGRKRHMTRGRLEDSA